MDVQIFNIVRLTWGNDDKQMKNFDTVLLMQIIMYTWRIINITFGQTKHLLTFEMKSMCHEQRLKSMCHEWKPKAILCNG